MNELEGGADTALGTTLLTPVHLNDPPEGANSFSGRER